MHQEPSGGSKVQKGSDLWITVSMGPEPPVKLMDNYIGVSAEQAYAALSGMGFTVLTKNEVSYVYEVGLVTRTDPASGAELAEGQTVYLYVSTGQEVIEAKMPDVVGLEIGRAKEWLSEQGFTNVRAESVESSKPKDQVVYQSVEKNKEIDVNSEIIIHYSQGPQETEEPQTQPEEEQPSQSGAEEITLSLTFDLPERDKDYTLDICRSGTPEVLVSKVIPAGTTSITVDLTGSGTMWYDLYIDGAFECEQEKVFTDD